MTTSRSSRQAFIGAGANLGDRTGTLAAAIAKLRTWKAVDAVECSSIYETEPIGVTEQPKFLNLVAGIETTLSPEELLQGLLEIERAFGRTRTVRWGPRTLDLDLLLFEGETRATPGLQLPHPRMFERAFVRVPLLELLRHPRFRQPCWATLADELMRAKDSGGVMRFSSDGGGERS